MVASEFSPAASALVALLVLILLVGGWTGRGRFEKLLRAVRRDPRALDRFYRRSMIATWLLGLFVPLVVLVEPTLTAADVGLRLPAGHGLDYALALGFLAILVYGGVQRRRVIQSGRWPEAGRSPMMALLPRTCTQRMLAAGISVTAGVVEETIFRGLLTASAAAIFGVPMELAAVPPLLLFAWGHLYQGRAGLIGAGLLGVLFTVLYLISGSLLLPVILHIAQDLVALLLVPPPPPHAEGGGAAPLRGDAAPPRPEAGQGA